MLHTTRAVVLRMIRHGDRTSVLKTYTERFGARSYMLHGGGRKNGRQAKVQPLDRVELVVSEMRERDMNAVRELRVESPYLNVHNDPDRGILLLFAQEVFHRTLREEVADPALFEFVQTALEAIDTESKMAEIPLRILVGLSDHLGFLPELPEATSQHFDMREGQFLAGGPAHGLCMDSAASQAFGMLLRSHLTGDPPVIAATMRKILLDHLLTYFRLHVPGFGELRSPTVLHELLR